MNSKIVTIFVALLSIVGIALFLMVFGVEEGDTAGLSNKVGTLVTYSLVLLIIAAVVAVLGSLLGLFKNPAALKTSLMGLAALAVVAIIAYVLAPDGQVVDASQKILAEAGSQVSKLTSTGIWFSALLGIVASLFFVVDLVKGLIKS